MKTERFCWVTGALLLGVAVGWGVRVGGGGVAAQGEGPEASPPKPAEVLANARRVREERDRVLVSLAGLVANDRAAGASRAEREEALELLGDLHMSTPAVVNALMSNLYLRHDFGPGPHTSSMPLDPWREYPGLGALLKVGLPAIPPLVEEVRAQEDKGKWVQCLFDLNLAAGEHARSWLAEALRREKDPAGRSRLEQAVRYHFDGGGPYDLHSWFFRGLGNGEPWYNPQR